MYKYILLLLLGISSVASGAELADKMFDIRHIGYAEGISSQRVFSIVEDSYGVMWIATKAGIDRYNGQTMKNYTLPGTLYYGDLAARQLYLLHDVRKGLLAYDQTGRVYRYSVDKDRFELLLQIGQFIPGNIILNKLCFDRDGALWIGLDRGLYRQEADGSLSAVIEGRYVNDILSMGESLLVGTSTGIVQLSQVFPSRRHSLLDEWNVQTLFYDSPRGKLWVGTFDRGLSVLNLSTSKAEVVKGQDTDFLHPIRAITGYDSHTLLVGVDGGGVYTVDKDEKKAQVLFNAGDDTGAALRGNGVYAVTRDNQGNIWVGSYTGGISLAVLQKHPISVWTHQKENPRSLGGNNVNDIEENTDGSLWFAVDDGISICTNVREDTWKHVLKGVVVVSLCRAAGGDIWAGTYGGGVYLLNSQGDVLKHLSKQQGELATNYIFSVRQDAEGDLWIGALDGPLTQICQASGKKHLYDVRWVQSITVLDSTRVAAATVDGFFVIDKHTDEARSYATAAEFHNQNVSAYIISMLFNADSTVWLGTEGGGVNLYDMRSRKVRTFTTADGLPSNDIYSLQRDSHGRLWTSTGKGMAVIDSSQVYNINYMGDIDKEYNKSSFARLANGEFVYGSTDGAVFVRPSILFAADYQAPLRFTGLAVNDLTPREQETLPPLFHKMLADGTVELGYRHNSFVLTFESVNYRFQRDIAYRYMLEGYDKEWGELSANGRAAYRQVAPGRYLFKVQSLRRSSGKLIAEQDLELEVRQPWWNSWWAWSLYASLLAALFYLAQRYKVGQLQKRYSEEKLRFFVHTAHDIRTPVTLITAPLEDLEHESGLSDKARYYLRLAHEGTRKLQSLITQLLEFEKVSSSKLQPTLLPLDLADILTETFDSFRPLAEQKQIRMHFSVPDAPTMVRGDRRLLEMLFDNLLSNACKYTPSGGYVRVALERTRRKAEIKVEDSGIGIPQEAHKHIFVEVYRADNACRSQERGTGFGLLQAHRIVKLLHGRISFQSEEGKGTLFTVVLPTTRKALAPSCSLPLAQEEVDSTPQHGQSTEEVRPSTTIKSRGTLFIVEDHETLRHYLRHIFEPEYRVVTAADGKEALRYLSTEYPDIILSDVMMPGLQGDELCQLVKENPDTAGIPFVLLTAKAHHDAVVEGLKKGADDYIPKPFSTEILKLKVQGLIENRQRQRAYFMRQALAHVEAGIATNPGTISSDTEASTSSTVEATITEGDRQFISQATSITLDRLTDPAFSITTLCREMAMSRTLFYSRLKSLTGKGPQEFIRTIRLQKAAELLKAGQSVADVAIATGFVNTKYFSTLFKGEFGVQPSKYKGG
ncbi:MAG: response regulator [Mediterranea sp.]|jgi:signal transduction histidine kinase/ligand-binding sensor domain-containing protein/DNA-binding response OmpR family regulator|nr:response regulator [Mediterranea sp.]